MNERHHRGARRTLGVLVTAVVATAGMSAPAFATDQAAGTTGGTTQTTTTATTATAVTSHTTIAVDHSFQRSAPPVATVRTTAAGKATPSTTTLYVSGKRVATVKTTGTAKVRLPKQLGVGRHSVVAVSAPASGSVRKSEARTVVTSHKYGSRVVEDAVKYSGVRYKHGGTTRSGMDCSGFTQRVFRDTHVKKLPRTAAAQAHVGKKVSRAKARPGDLVHTAGHVGIYVGHGKMIDAPRPGKKIHVRTMYAAHWTFIRVSNAAISI